MYQGKSFHNKQEILNTWPEECFLFSILDGVVGGSDWIVDSVYQIAMSKPRDTRVHISFFPFRKHHHLINAFNFFPFLTKCFIDRTLLYAIQSDFIKVIMDAINYGCYVSTYLDKGILLGSNDNYFHIGYIFGYDSVKKNILVSDNFYSGKNGIWEVDFSTMQKAVLSAIVQAKVKNEGNKMVCFYRINQDYNHAFQKEILISNIENYLSSNEDTIYYPGDRNEIISFGLDVYHNLYDEVERRKAGFIDIRNMAFLCDIARLSKKRIRHLSEKGIITTSLKTWDIVNRQSKIYNILLMLCIKYNLKKDPLLKEDLLLYIKQVYQTEDMLGNHLLKLLKM